MGSRDAAKKLDRQEGWDYNEAWLMFIRSSARPNMNG